MTRTLGRPAVLFGTLAIIVALAPIAYIIFGLSGLVFALVAAQLPIAALGLKAIHIGARTKKQVNGVFEKQQRTDQLIADQLTGIGSSQDATAESLRAVKAQLKEIREHQDEVLVLHKQLRETQDSVSELSAAIESQSESLGVARDDLAAIRPQMATQYKKSIKNTDRRVADLLFNINDLLALYQELDSTRGLPKLDMWAASPDLLRFLWQQVAEGERRSILECGSGVSTVLLAQAFKQVGSGMITALEHNEAYVEKTNELLKERGLEQWATIIHAPLVETTIGDSTWQWYRQDDIPTQPVDLLIVDGPPQAVGPKSRYPALPILREQLSPHAAVVLDDYRRPDEQEVGEMWKSEFPEFIESKTSHARGTLVLINHSQAEPI